MRGPPGHAIGTSMGWLGVVLMSMVVAFRMWRDGKVRAEEEVETAEPSPPSRP